jgi:Flp pilus assembly protein TadD
MFSRSLVLFVFLFGCGTGAQKPRQPATAAAPANQSAGQTDPAPDPSSTPEAEPQPSVEDREVARLEQVAAHKERDPEVLLALGTARAKAGDLRGAAREFHRASRLAPKDHRPAYNLGNVLLRLKRNDEALAALTKATGLSPKNVDVLVALAIAQRRLGQLAKSRKTLVRGARLEAGAHHFRLQLNLGLTLEAAGKIKAAIKAYRRATLARPDDVRAHLHLGVLLGRRKKLAEAEAALRKAVAAKGRNIDARANLGSILLKLGKNAEAARHLEVAVRAQPDDGPLQMNLGLAYQRSGQHKKAAATYRRAVRLLPSSAEAKLQLGLSLARSGDPAGARRSVTDALQLDKKLRPAVDLTIQELGKSQELAPLEAALALTRAILAVFPDDKAARHNRLALESMVKRKRTQ